MPWRQARPALSLTTAKPTPKRACKAAQHPAARIRVLRQQQHALALFRTRHVGVIDPAFAVAGAQAMLGDDEAGVESAEPGFGEDHLPQRGVLVRGVRELQACAMA